MQVADHKTPGGIKTLSLNVGVMRQRAEVKSLPDVVEWCSSGTREMSMCNANYVSREEGQGELTGCPLQHLCWWTQAVYSPSDYSGYHQLQL